MEYADALSLSLSLSLRGRPAALRARVLYASGRCGRHSGCTLQLWRELRCRAAQGDQAAAENQSLATQARAEAATPRLAAAPRGPRPGVGRVAWALRRIAVCWRIAGRFASRRAGPRRTAAEWIESLSAARSVGGCLAWLLRRHRSRTAASAYITSITNSRERTYPTFSECERNRCGEPSRPGASPPMFGSFWHGRSVCAVGAAFGLESRPRQFRRLSALFMRMLHLLFVYARAVGEVARCF